MEYILSMISTGIKEKRCSLEGSLFPTKCSHFLISNDINFLYYQYVIICFTIKEYMYMDLIVSNHYVTFYVFSLNTCMYDY